jgi:hypothetical protein
LKKRYLLFPKLSKLKKNKKNKKNLKKAIFNEFFLFTSPNVPSEKCFDIFKLLIKLSFMISNSYSK